MALVPNSFEYNLLLWLVIVLIGVKILLTLYFGITLIKKRKQTGRISFDFTFGMFILMLCLAISRILFLYYDFFLTEFDPETFADPINVLVWRIAMIFYAIGYASVLFAIDKSILDFKFKGIFAYITIAILIIQLVYPIRTLQDFVFVNTLGSVGLLVAIVIPIIFIYLGIKTPTLRKSAFMIAIGSILFAIGAMLVVQSILEPLREAFGTDIQILMFLLFFIFKITGLSLFSYGVLTWKL
ncbi:MAG: hypothetical protein GF353_06295 [Candidatus Lokiarchaeota archaeon]|nr:hypothetical protein [Candidatus Lokiarchaeota archaeon]